MVRQTTPKCHPFDPKRCFSFGHLFRNERLDVRQLAQLPGTHPLQPLRVAPHPGPLPALLQQNGVAESRERRLRRPRFHPGKCENR